MERSIGRIAIGAVVAFLLQIVAAPNIAVAGAQPNFALAYVLVVAIVRPDEAGNVMPFLLGLACDLMGTGPVGAEAFLFTLASFGASRAFMVLDNDTLFMPLAIFSAATLLVELSYGCLLMLLGLQASFADAFMYRVLPCSLFTIVVGLVLYPILMRLLRVGQMTRGTGIPVIR